MHTIDDVLERLNGIIAEAEAERSRLGFFAALYRNMTLQVKAGILNGSFDDGARMERMDVCFASRYIDAYDAFRAGRRPTEAWRLAFEAAEHRRLTIVQHLLLGINAHINLDLGIAAAEIAPGVDLPGFQRDFDQINSIIHHLVMSVEQEIGAVSPWIDLLNRWAGRTDNAIINFSIDIARHEAWQFACALAPLPQDRWPGLIDQRDRIVSGIGQRVIAPGFIIGTVTKIVSVVEPRNPAKVIKSLASRAPAPAVAAPADAESAVTLQE